MGKSKEMQSMAGLLLQWLVDHRVLVTTLLLSLLPVVMLLAKCSGAETKKRKLPPSPSKFPIIGNLHQLGKLPHRSLRDLSVKHGPLMVLQQGGIATVVVSSAKMAKEVLKTHELDFSNRPSMTAGKNLFYDSKDMAFAPYGDYWRELRKICVSELLSAKRVQSFRPVREEEVTLLIENISRSCNPSGLIDLRTMFRSLTLDINCRTSLGNKYSELGGIGQSKSRFSELRVEFMQMFAAIHIGDFFPSMGWIDVLVGTVSREKKVAKRMDVFLEQVIEDHLQPKREESDHKDFVDVMLQVQKDSSLNFPFTRETMKAVILDMFMGGTDTVSITIEWAMAELARNPEAMKKAQAEVRQVVGGKLKVEESDLHQLEFLKATIKETLRLHPPGPLSVPRESINDAEIEGYFIPAKSRVLINIWAIERDPETWDKAEEFQPERFMNSSLDFKGQDFRYIPFGYGRRSCPGATFALHVIELTLANLLYHFNWEVPDGIDPMDLDMTEQAGLLVTRKSPLVLVVTPYLS